MKTKILLSLAALLIIIQFFRPERNLSDEHTNDISNKYMLPDSVSAIMKVACNDCHTNLTKYPWYAEIQPIAWWLNHHITDGKRHLNFSTFTTRPIAVQNHKFEEFVDLVKKEEMPLPSYTWFGLHEGADLSGKERKMLIRWAEENMNMLKAQYPPDSLVLKRR